MQLPSRKSQSLGRLTTPRRLMGSEAVKITTLCKMLGARRRNPGKGRACWIMKG